MRQVFNALNSLTHMLPNSVSDSYTSTQWSLLYNSVHQWSTYSATLHWHSYTAATAAAAVLCFGLTAVSYKLHLVLPVGLSSLQPTPTEHSYSSCCCCFYVSAHSSFVQLHPVLPVGLSSLQATAYTHWIQSHHLKAHALTTISVIQNFPCFWISFVSEFASLYII